MTANVTDLTRVTGTIACSGAAAANPITNSVLRTALGYNTIGLCTIGSSDGYYTMFGFKVDTTGGRTWDFAVDDIGDGTYTTLKSTIASGANVVIGILPGAFSDGTVVGARRPFSFQVTLSSADASSVISFAAMRVLPNDARMVAADLTSTNTAIAAITAAIGSGGAIGTVFETFNYLTETFATDTTAKLGTPAGASISADIAAVDADITTLLSPVIATGTLDGVFVHTDTIFECSALSATMDLYSGSKCVVRQASSGAKCYRNASSYSTANKRVTLSSALPFTMVNGDTFVFIP